jgi:hypothetical protein
MAREGAPAGAKDDRVAALLARGDFCSATVQVIPSPTSPSNEPDLGVIRFRRQFDYAACLERRIASHAPELLAGARRVVVLMWALLLCYRSWVLDGPRLGSSRSRTLKCLSASAVGGHQWSLSTSGAAPSPVFDSPRLHFTEPRGDPGLVLSTT